MRIWDPVTGRIVRELRGFAAPPQSVNFDPGGHFLATTEYTPPGAVKLWDARSGEQLSTVPDNVGPGDFGADFSRDGKHLVVCGELGVKLWSVVDVGQSGRRSPAVVVQGGGSSGSESSTDSVCFSPDGQFFAWTDGCQVSVYERATGQMHSWPVNVFRVAVALLPAGWQTSCARQPGHGND